MNIAFIPVRCGSKSIPFKNIKSFCGRPLIYWNLKALEDSKNIDKIYVATDCEKIKRIVSQFQFSKVSVFERNKENAKDESSTESVILEFLSKKGLCLNLGWYGNLNVEKLTDNISKFMENSSMGENIIRHMKTINISQNNKLLSILNNK